MDIRIFCLKLAEEWAQKFRALLRRSHLHFVTMLSGCLKRTLCKGFGLVKMTNPKGPSRNNHILTQKLYYNYYIVPNC